jgi:hypothetical protein
MGVKTSFVTQLRRYRLHRLGRGYRAGPFYVMAARPFGQGASQSRRPHAIVNVGAW